MVISLLAVGVKLLLNYVLVFGHWGFPALGLVGAGYSTMLVEYFMFGLAVLYSLWRFAGQGLFKLSFSFAPLLEIVRFGFADWN